MTNRKMVTFTNLTGKARKPYIFSHRRLQKLEKIFSEELLVVSLSSQLLQMAGFILLIFQNKSKAIFWLKDLSLTCARTNFKIFTNASSIVALSSALFSLTITLVFLLVPSSSKPYDFEKLTIIGLLFGQSGFSLSMQF